MEIQFCLVKCPSLEGPVDIIHIDDFLDLVAENHGYEKNSFPKACALDGGDFTGCRYVIALPIEVDIDRLCRNANWICEWKKVEFIYNLSRAVLPTQEVRYSRGDLRLESVQRAAQGNRPRNLS